MNPSRGAGTTVAVLAVLLASAPLGAATPAPTPTSTPSPVASPASRTVTPGAPQTPPPLSATATPAPSGKLVSYTGQLLDVRRGFVFFTTGDGFRLAPDARIVDAKTGGTAGVVPRTALYARASFDTGTGAVVVLGVSTSRLPPEARYEDVQKFAVALSTPAPNPELAAGRGGFNGKPVLITFTVRVPDRTPLGDDVYLATDVSDWDPKAVKMNRIDVLHYQIKTSFPSGTDVHYRYTRGTWRTEELGQDGLEVKPREVLVINADTLTRDDTVYHWADATANSSDFTQGIPTPFNPRPFVTPPPNRPRH